LTLHDASFPSVADYVDDKLHFVYYCDPLAGNALQGIHGDVRVAFMYHTVDKVEILNVPASVNGSGSGLPTGFHLEQNYPNPFNPSTTIGYTLNRGGHVSIMVYDMLGRRVCSLVEEEQSAGRTSDCMGRLIRFRLSCLKRRLCLSDQVRGFSRHKKNVDDQMRDGD
jgi:hypothetical protein